MSAEREVAGKMLAFLYKWMERLQSFGESFAHDMMIDPSVREIFRQDLDYDKLNHEAHKLIVESDLPEPQKDFFRMVIVGGIASLKEMKEMENKNA